MYSAENVRSDGCKSKGRLADKNCKAQPCAIEKKVESCASRNEFPCAKVRNLMASREDMLLNCYPKTADITKEEFDLCMRQFLSMPNLLKNLTEQGKIPKSLLEGDEEK